MEERKRRQQGHEVKQPGFQVRKHFVSPTQAHVYTFTIVIVQHGIVEGPTF
jgi:hypothetical protein